MARLVTRVWILNLRRGPATVWRRYIRNWSTPYLKDINMARTSPRPPVVHLVIPIIAHTRVPPQNVPRRVSVTTDKLDPDLYVWYDFCDDSVLGDTNISSGVALRRHDTFWDLTLFFSVRRPRRPRSIPWLLWSIPDRNRWKLSWENWASIPSPKKYCL